jgi:broad specificity phosphatase PhoE
MKLIFVRHGQTVANAENRLQGHLDTELSPLGLHQARIVAAALAQETIEAVYSSDCQRASVTAEIVAAPHSLPVATDPLLREARLGDWQGMTVDEIERQYPIEYQAWRRDSISNRPPGAERLEEVIARVNRFFDKVTAKHSKGSILLVAHGGSIRAAVCCCLDSGPAPFRRIRLDNAGVTRISWPPAASPMLIRANDTCHLRSADTSTELQEM